MILKNIVKFKKLILLFAATVIVSSIGHQIKGGYQDPRKSRPRYRYTRPRYINLK